MAGEFTAKRTLRRAELFLAQANIVAASALGPEWDGCIANLEAAIQFGRNVTVQLQNDLAHVAGGMEWYEGRREELKGDRLAHFMNEWRRLSVHATGAPARAEERPDESDLGLLDTMIVMPATPPGPWYTWDVSAVVQQVGAWLMLPWWHLEGRRRLRAHARRIEQQSLGPVVDVYFDDALWGRIPARQLVERYLRRMALIVQAAEQKFGRA